MSSAPSQHGDKREAIVASVIEMVVRGELKAGQRLVTQELADQFGVSLTPVREALAELAVSVWLISCPIVARVSMPFHRERFAKSVECDALWSVKPFAELSVESRHRSSKGCKRS